MTAPIRYQLSLADRDAHVLRVRCTVDLPAPAGQVFTLPAWTPGSYLLRHHARQVLTLTAQTESGAVVVTKLDRQRWQCAPCVGALTLEYRVYAFDDSVRAAWLDQERAFINGAAVFMRAEGLAEQPHALTLTDIPSGWQVATTLEPQGNAYTAENYAAFIDHPLLCGHLQQIPFTAAGIDHRLVLDGAGGVDETRLAQDLARICASQHALFADDAAPLFPQYQFLTRVMARGYGGLEHRSSTALICARDALPVAGAPSMTTAYRSFLGLCSHEYFHLWNVKRIRPEAFALNDLTTEAYTRDLWAYEGITSYYDDLMLLRAGVIQAADYLDLVAQAATRLSRTPGRLEQSLADSSFDAWIKFYKSDENTPNSQVSYYNKGALVALLLDLHLRQHSDATLDSVMQTLWQRYGRKGIPVPEQGLERVAAECSGLALDRLFDAWVRGVDELPLESALAAFGVTATRRLPHSEPDAGGRYAELEQHRADLGLRTQSREGRLTVAHVLTGGAAQQAGVHPGDELIAWNGQAIDAQNWPQWMKQLQKSEVVSLSMFRQGQLRHCQLTAQSRAADTWTMTLQAVPSSEVYARRRAWLGS